jgi:tRNA G46 methylase TrmB
MEISMRSGEMLQEIAVNNWAEYFIGIGKDQNEVLEAKSNFAELDPPNASAFWGDTQKLLPSILNKSIDNFLIVVPQVTIKHATKLESEPWLKSILRILPQKLSAGGTLQILTDVETNSSNFKELVDLVVSENFELSTRNDKKIYFPMNYRDSSFIPSQNPQTLLFKLNGS